MAEILKPTPRSWTATAPAVILEKARTDSAVGSLSDDSLGTSEVLLSAIVIERVGPARWGRAGRRRTHDSGRWRRYFESICAERPVVALIEDIHWADDPVFELIESLSTRT